MSKNKLIVLIIVIGALAMASALILRLNQNGSSETEEENEYSPIVYQPDGYIRLDVEVGPDILIDNRDGSVEVSQQPNGFKINEIRLVVLERREKDVKQWITDKRVEDTGAAQGIYPYERVGVPIELYGLPASLWIVKEINPGQTGSFVGGRPSINLDDRENNRFLSIDGLNAITFSEALLLDRDLATVLKEQTSFQLLERLNLQ